MTPENKIQLQENEMPASHNRTARKARKAAEYPPRMTRASRVPRNPAMPCQTDPFLSALPLQWLGRWAGRQDGQTGLVSPSPPRCKAALHRARMRDPFLPPDSHSVPP